MDYDSVCINGSTVQFLSGLTMALSTVNIFIFLFDLYIKYEIMSYDPSNDTSKSLKKYEKNDQEEEDGEDDQEEEYENSEEEDNNSEEENNNSEEEEEEVKEEIVV